MSRPPVRDAEALQRSILRRIGILERRRTISGLPPRLIDLGAGTTAERDALYGVPATDPERVALANAVVSWFNTDLGWTETYYAVTGLSGLTAKGLIAGTASGWYPVGLGPWMVLEPSAAFNATTNAYVGNWNGTVRKRDPSGTALTANAQYIGCNLPGYYDLELWTEQQTGSGTADWTLRHLNSAGTAIVRQQRMAGPTLHASYYTRAEGAMKREPMSASDRLYLFCSAGALAIHNSAAAGDVRGAMSAVYTGPLLVSD